MTAQTVGPCTSSDELVLSQILHTPPRVWVSGRRCLGKGRGRPSFDSLMLDAENWKIVFKVYAGHPVSALTLAYQLIAIRQSLQHGPKGIPEAIAGLDLAIEGLYPHTDFHKMGRKMYHRTIEGTIRPKQEDILRKLGMKI